MQTTTEPRDIPIDQIEPTFSRARDKDGWEALKASMKARGQLQPIKVKDLGRRNADGIRYKLIFGEGRTLAAKSLGWEKITALVETEISDEKLVGEFFNENVNRVGLAWIDKARIIRDEMKGLKGEEKDAAKRLAAVCRELNISLTTGQKYFNTIQRVAGGLEEEVGKMGMNVVEKLTKLPARGQLIVMEVAKETQQSVESVVAKAEKLQAKSGDGWTTASLHKAITGTKDTLAKQRNTLKTQRLDYACGPQNVLRLARKPAFNAAMKKAGINLETLEKLEL